MSHLLPSPVAIDGPAASGKSTVGQALAARFGYRFLDTGLMYRAIALAALRAKIPASDAEACAELARTVDMRVVAAGDTTIFLGGEDITGELKSPPVEAAVSDYSKIPELRVPMVERQRAIAAEAPTVVAGRDIGTVVFPDAPLKFFFDASENARAERRGRQAQQTSQQAQQDIVNRDRLDSSRASSPLKAAEDAIYIDTTNLPLEQVVAIVVERVQCAIG